MSSGYAQELLKGVTGELGAEATDVIIGNPFTVSYAGSRHLLVVVDVEAVTSNTGITIQLQEYLGDAWVDSKSQAVTTAGIQALRFNADNADDKTYMPLATVCRVVASTGATDALEVNACWVIQGK